MEEPALNTQKPSRRGLVVTALLSTTLLAGCVSQGDYDALKAENTQLQQQLAAQSAELAASKQQTERLTGAIKYTVESDLLFPSGSWEISPQGKRIMASMARKLTPTQQRKLIVVGYTDNVPIGPALMRKGITSNKELSQKRAESVMQFLIANGMNPELVSAQGYGEQNPVASNSTPAGRAKNRRVEFNLVSS